MLLIHQCAVAIQESPQYIYIYYIYKLFDLFEAIPLCLFAIFLSIYVYIELNGRFYTIVLE